MRVRRGKKSEKKLAKHFHKHFGSSPLDIAEMWFDLCHHEDELLTKKEKSEKGFLRFISAHYWLWFKPKNAKSMASRLGVSVDYGYGERLWKWIRLITKLLPKKIYWDPSLDAADTEIFAITTDGVDFKLWERQDPDFPYDPKNMSHKFKSCGAKYIIALSTYRSKCVFIEGPYRGGKHDLDMFRESGLMQKMKESGKVVIADRGFRSKLVSEQKHFATPDYMDDQELHNMKSRARLRQETFNRRLKHFEALASTWNLAFEKHGIALRAIATIVQYQMDNGSPLYCV